VRGDVVPAVARDADDRSLERLVLERLDLPAVVADEVMVVLGAARGLEPRDSVAEVDPLDEAAAVEALEHAVHARDADARAPGANAVVDLERGEAAVLPAEVLDHLAPGGPAAATRGPQALERVLGPGELLGHEDNDTRSQRRASVVRTMRRTALLLLVFACGGCGSGDEGNAGRTVVAGFYPLAWAAERVAGPDVEVVNLTPPGAEPHDLELSAQAVGDVGDAELVVYLGGFQPALEDAVAARDGGSLDVLPPGERDRHVWLDPVQFSGVVRRVAGALRGSAAGTVKTLGELDADYRRGLRRCASRVLVTTHAAFGHLAERYDLEQLSLAGSSPESEPGPRELERLIDDVRASGATTVFAEPLVSDRVAETVAREVGAEIAVLDPLEGLSEERLESGADYVSVMRANLATLRTALGCR
jgi:zinc transport system substrate-binding protein